MPASRLKKTPGSGRRKINLPPLNDVQKGLVQKNLGLLYKAVSRYWKRNSAILKSMGYDYESVVHQMVLKFPYLLKKFDPSRGAFSTYLFAATRSEIKHLVTHARLRAKVNISTSLDQTSASKRSSRPLHEKLSGKAFVPNRLQQTKELLIARLDGLEGVSKRDKMLFVLRNFSEPRPTLQKIGEIFGLTRERTRQINDNIVEKLRRDPVIMQLLE